LRKFKGCPDTDNDSIIDSKDDCPDIAGIIAFNGCPDTDGDGIKDSEDECPQAPGTLVNHGCPDSDSDGVLDIIDGCIDVAGPVENNGCPWPDTDADGLLDKDDKCPFIAGPIKNQGCPYQDTDEDGILDEADQCPTVKGVVENNGCPKIEEAEKEILKTAFDNLEFNTGNAVIKTGSFASLDDLAALLIKKKEWKLQIAGHTDNVGNDQTNLILSKKRSEAVKAYLVSKGVEATRINSIFFGETQPIATNDTEEGRSKNRRVEMTVVFQ
jgi:outer membrane protein OmpA-like peptidoglycan-associated protein